MAELDDLRAEHWQYRNTIALIDAELRPYYERQRSLQVEIIMTFPEHAVVDDRDARGPTLGVIAHSLEGAPERAGLFAELDRLNETFAPTVRQRRNLTIEARTLRDLITRLEDYERTHPQRDLFMHAKV